MNKDTLKVEFNLNHVPVQSSNLLSVAWDSEVLEVIFKSGAKYRYLGVPFEVYQDLIDPDVKISKGQYFNKRVKEAGYVYQRINP